MKRFFTRIGVADKDRAIVGTMYFTFFVSGLVAIILGALLPVLQTEGNLTYTQSGALFSFHQAGNLCAVVLSSFLPYLIGKKNATLIFGIGITIGMLVMTVSSNPLIYVLAFVLTGLARGTLSNVCNATVSEKSTKSVIALNLLHSVFAIGALLSPFLLYLCSKHFVFAWRGAAWMIAVLGSVFWVLIAKSDMSNSKGGKERNPRFRDIQSAGFWLSTAT